jgi:hypothetical protein
VAGAVLPTQSIDTHAVEWLALSLTAGLGTTKARRLVEHFGSVQEIFRASLTELEAAGIQTISAQSLGTGRSMELGQEELARAVAAGITLLVPDDPAYPAQLKQIYDPPLALRARECGRGVAARDRPCRHPLSHALWYGHGGTSGVRFGSSRAGNF